MSDLCGLNLDELIVKNIKNKMIVILPNLGEKEESINDAFLKMKRFFEKDVFGKRERSKVPKKLHVFFRLPIKNKKRSKDNVKINLDVLVKFIKLFDQNIEKVYKYYGFNVKLVFHFPNFHSLTYATKIAIGNNVTGKKILCEYGKGIVFALTEVEDNEKLIYRISYRTARNDFDDLYGAYYPMIERIDIRRWRP